MQQLLGLQIEMFDDANMRLGLYPFFHMALLIDFGSFALCMTVSDRLFDSAHSSTASPSLSVEVYPQSVLWLLEVANYNMRYVSDPRPACQKR